ncbi:MAG: 4Fe-4S binding protein [Sedimentisphaerales bacterium]|nr:4Fe-4S binding protein [Sedimentisphaerales bacterium]
MKIAVTSTGPDLDSQVEPRFGRCPYFLIIDPETMEYQALENPNVALGGGAGIQSAQLLASHGAQTVLTGNCGPNAYATLAAAEIQVVVGVSGIVRQAAEQFQQGASASATEPNVASHFGMTNTNQAGSNPGSGDMGRGMGRGMSGGMGGGTGGGHGMGRQGGGRGMGRKGAGGGMGRPTGMGQGTPVAPIGMTAPAGQVQGEPELDRLKAQARELDAQLQAIKTRIQQVEQAGPASTLVAMVYAERCTTCGLCQRACPAGAIFLEQIARIDPAKCTGCGLCVAECPQDAIVLKKP